jgi:predicted outer membrane repeat protein
MFGFMWQRIRRSQSVAPGAGRRGRQACRLSMEGLEDRCTLSTFTVTSLGDAGSGSGFVGDLRYAINMANGNADLSNRIVFQPGLAGTITLTHGKLVVTKALGIFGPGADLLTVSGNHQSGVFDIGAPAGQTVFLSDVTIADGTGAGQQFGAPAGGGLFNDAATLVLERTTFARNTVPFQLQGGAGGAGLFNLQGTVTVNDSLFTENQAGLADGIAISNWGTMAIHASTFTANPGGENGTIKNTGTMTLDRCVLSDDGAFDISGASGLENFGMLTVTACTFTGNSGFEGGGLLNFGIATVTDSTFLNNYARNTGGAIANVDGNLTISGSTFAGNTTLYSGGGIAVGGGYIGMTNSTVSGNSVRYFGGGIYYQAGILEVTSSTVAFNATTVAFPGGDAGGGGVYAEDGRVLLRNTIVADNTTAQDGPDVLGSVASFGYNLIGQADHSSGWVATDWTGTGDAPLDPRLGPLQDNGGLTPTHALLPGSPALQVGDPAARGTVDQRGSVRGRPGILPIPADIGAFDAMPVAQFLVLSPASVGVGEPFAVTVVALDQWGNVASTYTGTVHFSSTDLFALLPDDTAFSPDDGGAHTFSVALLTPGQQTIQVVDTAPSSDPSGSTTVDVSSFPTPRGPEFLADLFAAELEGPYLLRTHA